LAFTCSRRDFWPALIEELLVIRDSVRGKPGFRLAGLSELPDERLAPIRPIVNPQYEILVEGEYVCCRAREKGETRRLFGTQKENVFAFNHFNGQHTLGTIGARLAQEMGWEEAQGFAHARDLFLALVERLVCVPEGPLGLP
jgi:hypothetical protein